MYCFGEAYEVGVWEGERAACVAGGFVWRARQLDQRSGREQAVNRKKTPHFPGGFVARSRPPSVAPSQQNYGAEATTTATSTRTAKKQQV